MGYVSAALINNWLHHSIGQRGISLLGGGCHLIASIINAFHPPFPVLVCSFILAGIANGVGNAAWNAWVSTLRHSTQLLGCLHAFYGVGGVFSPLVATAMITKAGRMWYEFYYVMVCIPFTLSVYSYLTSSPCNSLLII